MRWIGEHPIRIPGALECAAGTERTPTGEEAPMAATRTSVAFTEMAAFGTR